jgi:hypothetical protein
VRGFNLLRDKKNEAKHAGKKSTVNVITKERASTKNPLENEPKKEKRNVNV